MRNCSTHRLLRSILSSFARHYLARIVLTESSEQVSHSLFSQEFFFNFSAIEHMMWSKYQRPAGLLLWDDLDISPPQCARRTKYVGPKSRARRDFQLRFSKNDQSQKRLYCTTYSGSDPLSRPYLFAVHRMSAPLQCNSPRLQRQNPQRE